MSMHRKNRFIALWKAELKAAEEAVDRLTELSHRAIARRYACWRLPPTITASGRVPPETASATFRGLFATRPESYIVTASWINGGIS
jgi:hypothetical protein